ncbi:NUDIX domain-containing protein [Aliishimia ponticola]|uniref:NUDIX domain-containing protein n=1 Tax=Aliishimia ponticola TaxID=2499833 RepID=A0A4S4N9I2_9RHOB|nr:NUDIX hydrolase [Aliishimia ponticola]THH34661.1 NUDIX domain-containing protein [Aliishimia ponticola]
MIPRVGETMDISERYRLRPGAYAILPYRGRLLLTAQWGDAVDIQLPGGGIEPGEAVRPALFREVMEETGWTISAPRRLGAFRRFVYMPEYDLMAEKLCHIYVARPGRRLSDPSEPDHDPLWLTPEDALDALGNDGDRLFLHKAIRHGFVA